MTTTTTYTTPHYDKRAGKWVFFISGTRYERDNERAAWASYNWLVGVEQIKSKQERGK